MTTSQHKQQGLRARQAWTAPGWLTPSMSPLPAPATHAADPYDKSLEVRMEAFGKKRNITEDDSKGRNVQELTISGDLRFAYNIEGGEHIQEIYNVPEGEFRDQYHVTDGR